MDKALWEQLKPILEVALTLNHADRDTYLKEACSGNIKQYETALRLLAHESPVTLGLSEMIELTEPLSMYQEGQIFGNYKLIKEIGRGGMGAVFLAERTDGEYDQKVAIKILQEGRTSDSLIHKLRNERQILANLKHPNIVNILDGGTTDQGIPFIVMEYVDGTVITDYIEEHNLSLQQRLDLFQKLCEVISYAHQKLIIHRDIKPSNILISQTGELKLLDFGIAKILDQQGQSFQETQQLFITPDYASPEHIKGQPLTTASEVYSLGILFYQILTGVNPFKSVQTSLSSMIERVCDYNPPPPSKLSEKTNAKLNSDIDNICLKALRKDPKDRYQSVDHFSQDIDRYLKHLPVSATKDQWSYRAKKYLVRNQSYLISGLIIFLITMAGLFSSVYQAREARAMFNDLRGLTGSILFEFYDGVANLDGATAVKELMVSKALTYLSKMENRNSDNPDLMHDVSYGYQRLGNIQGNSYYFNMGFAEDALKSYNKAVSISEKLVNQKPGNQKFIFNLSQAYMGMGDITYTLGQLDSTLLLYQKSNKLLSELTEKYPDTLNYWLALSESYNRIGDVSGMYGYANLGNTSLSISSYRQSTDILERILKKEPENNSIRHSLAAALTMLCSLYTGTGNYNKAVETGYKSISSFEALLKKDSTNYSRISYLLRVKNVMRDPLTEIMKMDEALILLKDVESRLLKSLAIDSKNQQTKSNLAINYNAIGRVLCTKGEYENAILQHQNAYSISKALLKDSENNFSIWRSIGQTAEFMGNAYFENKQYNNAKKEYDEAIAIFKKTDIDLINFVKIKLNLCLLFRKNQDTALLNEHQRDLLALEKISRKDTLNIKNIIFLSECYGNTARALVLDNGGNAKSSPIQDPCYYFQRSLELSDRLLSKNALSPLRSKEKEELIKSLPNCVN